MFLDSKINKLKPKSKICVFIGYALDYKGYRCFDPTTNKVFTSHHVLFHEHKFPYCSLVGTKSTMPYTSPLVLDFAWSPTNVSSPPCGRVTGQSCPSAPRRAAAGSQDGHLHLPLSPAPVSALPRCQSIARWVYTLPHSRVCLALCLFSSCWPSPHSYPHAAWPILPAQRPLVPSSARPHGRLSALGLKRVLTHFPRRLRVFFDL